MDITPQLRPDQKLIQSYGAGFFRVNGDVLKQSIVICGDHVTPWNHGDNPLALSDDILALRGQIDILLIGVGERFAPLPPSKRAAFSGLGMTVDVMDTASACRTFNVLTAESRRVAAALVLL